MCIATIGGRDNFYPSISRPIFVKAFGVCVVIAGRQVRGYKYISYIGYYIQSSSSSTTCTPHSGDLLDLHAPTHQPTSIEFAITSTVKNSR